MPSMVHWMHRKKRCNGAYVPVPELSVAQVFTAPGNLSIDLESLADIPVTCSMDQLYVLSMSTFDTVDMFAQPVDGTTLYDNAIATTRSQSGLSSPTISSKGSLLSNESGESQLSTLLPAQPVEGTTLYDNAIAATGSQSGLSSPTTSSNGSLLSNKSGELQLSSPLPAQPVEGTTLYDNAFATAGSRSGVSSPTASSNGSVLSSESGESQLSISLPAQPFEGTTVYDNPMATKGSQSEVSSRAGSSSGSVDSNESRGSQLCAPMPGPKLLPPDAAYQFLLCELEPNERIAAEAAVKQSSNTAEAILLTDEVNPYATPRARERGSRCPAAVDLTTCSAGVRSDWAQELLPVTEYDTEHIAAALAGWQ
jgi:hypothetical protein